MEIKNDDELYIAKMKDGAIIPTKRDEDAGYDIYPCFDGDYFVIDALKTRAVPTGIAMAFSKKYYAQVEERSSTGKLGIKRSSGVLDSGYRGEYLIMTYNTNTVPLVISKISENEMPDEFEVDGKTFKKAECVIYPSSKAICEIVFHEVPKLKTNEISYEDLLTIESERGANGFGSSKK